MGSNFRITEDFALGQGGAKTKARRNLAAITLLKQLEGEGREANAEEQAVLAQYVGWGGIPQVFNPTPDDDWQALASEVKAILEPSEYNSAFESVLNAHYTSPEVIREIYQGLDYLGFKGGKILEPSMGVGNFLGMMPVAVEQRSEVTGIELDSITGRIAKQLYPEHQIYVQGFEKTPLPNDYFDLALSNVPFGDYRIGDPEYNDLNLKVHNYFFAKALDRVRPGGLVSFITSTGTMQSRSNKGFRAWMAERANLVGAMRLPGDAFKTNAGTEVTTDLIILQKLGPSVSPSQENWIDVVDAEVMDAEGKPLQTNEYYARNPERMLGIPCDDKLHPGRLALEGEGNTLERMRETFAAFPSEIYSRNNAVSPFTGEAVRLPTSEEGRLRTFITPEYQSLKNFGYVSHQGQVWQRQGDWLQQTALSGKTAERVLGMLEIRDAVEAVFEVQIQGGTDAELAQRQERLNQVYEQFVQKYGYLSDTVNSRAFRVDPDAQLVLALEIRNEKTKEVTKADVFSHRTVRPRVIKASAESAQEALLTSLNEYGRVVPGYMAQLLSRPEAEVIQELQTQNLIFQEPITAKWQTQDEYLSGNVREKLKIAQSVAQTDERYQVNVQALEGVQPRDLGPGEIEVRLGAPWLPTETIAEFASSLLELDPQQKRITVEHSPQMATWVLEADNATKQNALNTSTHGTAKLSALDLIELTLNLKDATVHYRTTEGEYKLDQEATLAARMKQQQIQDKFKSWIWKDFERSENLCRIYNDLFNDKVERNFKNPNLEMPGSSPSVTMRPHQKDGVWRTLQSDATLLAHVVGAGKTYTMVASAIEMRRLGIAQKPMIVVPNHMLRQFTQELYQLYPNAKVLAPSETETQASKRRELMARISTGDWDAVVVTHSAFTRLQVSDAQKEEFYQIQLDEVDSLLGDADVKQGNAIVKQLARERKKIQERIDKITQSKQKDNGVTFEQLGVDALFVDEAHFWKNLGRATKLQNIAGLSNTNSQRAMDAFMKCRIVQKNGGRLVFATGTPVSNSIAELYTMQRFLQPDALERQGISNFDAWVGAFAEKVTAPEIDPTGRFKLKTRLTRFTNVPELMTLFREVADIKTADQLDLPRPEVERITIAAGASPLQLDYIDRLIARAEAVTNRRVKPDVDNMLWVTTDGRRASLDPRLISEALPDFPESKVNQAIANIEEIWRATGEERLTQMVFCDLGTPKKGKGEEKPFSVYEHIKAGLIARGVPAEEIAFIHDAPKSKDKENLYAAVREGRIRVLIGSTEKCGVGMNVQERLVAEHHIDPPWRPSDIEQREGRILRQGNKNKKVMILTYVTQGRDGKLGFDSYSWQTLARKAEMVAQVMNGDSTVRSVEDVSSSALSFDEIKAIATGNPLIIEKATVDSRVTELGRYQQSFMNERFSTQYQVKSLPGRIEELQENIQKYAEDLGRRVDTRGDLFHMRVGRRSFEKREEAGEQILGALSQIVKENPKKSATFEIGELAGFQVLGVKRSWDEEAFVRLRSPNGMTYEVNGSDNAFGLVRSMEHSLGKIEMQLSDARLSLAQREADLVTYTKDLDVPFQYEEELAALLVRQQEINTELGLNKNDEQTLEAGEEEESPTEGEGVEAAAAEGAAGGDVAGEETEESEIETVNLDDFASADAEWTWLSEGEVEWETDITCAASPQVIEALERLMQERDEPVLVPEALEVEGPPPELVEEPEAIATSPTPSPEPPPTAPEPEDQAEAIAQAEERPAPESSEAPVPPLVNPSDQRPSQPEVTQQLSILGALTPPEPTAVTSRESQLEPKQASPKPSLLEQAQRITALLNANATANPLPEPEGIASPPVPDGELAAFDAQPPEEAEAQAAAAPPPESATEEAQPSPEAALPLDTSDTAAPPDALPPEAETVAQSEQESPPLVEATAAQDETLVQPLQEAEAIAAEAEAQGTVKAIAPIAEHEGQTAQILAVFLHEGGIAKRIFECESFYLRVENEPFMPLVIERHENQLYLSHYQTQNGDMFIDAEMVFEISAEGKLTLIETATQDPFRGGENRGRSDSFARLFSENLLSQGFDDALAQQMQEQTMQPEPATRQESIEASPEAEAVAVNEQSPTAVEAAVVEDRSEVLPEPEGQEQTTTEGVAEPPPSVSPAPEQPAPPPEITPVAQPSVVPPSAPVQGASQQPIPLTPAQVQSWASVAQALSKGENYRIKVAQVVAAYQAGEPLSAQAAATLTKDLAQHQQTLNKVKDWYRLASQQELPPTYLEKICNVGEGFKQGQPLSEGAIKAMQHDFRRAEWTKLSQGVTEPTPERHTARVALRGLQEGKSYGEVLGILNFDPALKHLKETQGPEAAREYGEKALAFALNYYKNPQQSMNQEALQSCQWLTNSYGQMRETGERVWEAGGYVFAAQDLGFRVYCSLRGESILELSSDGRLSGSVSQEDLDKFKAVVDKAREDAAQTAAQQPQQTRGRER